MGFPFHAPLDPLKTYEELSSLSIPFVLKPTLPSNRLLEGTDPTIYVTYSSSVSKMMTEQGNTECYDELVLDGIAEYAFVSPFLSDAEPIIFSDVRPGDVVSWCAPWSHRSTMSSSSKMLMTYRVTNPSSLAYRSSFSDASVCSLRRPEDLLSDSSSSRSHLDSFYSSSISETKSLLGSKTRDEIHFHHGLWTEGSSYESAAADAVRSFYDHIASKSRVLDVGSGWCGPADLLVSERDADVVALTVSQAQSFYCRSRGHRTVNADAETLDLVGKCVFERVCIRARSARISITQSLNSRSQTHNSQSHTRTQVHLDMTLSMCHFCWKVWSILQTSLVCCLVFVMCLQNS